MPRFFIPRHARTHLPGGSDPLAITSGSDLEIPWAIIDSTAAETLPASTSMTFALSSHNFNTNDPATFSIRSGAPAFQGIEFLRTGVYEVVFYVSATKNSAVSPETWVLSMTAGVQGGDAYPNEFDLSSSRVYGISTPGSSPNQGQWKLRSSWLVGVDDVADNPSTTVGATNHEATAITTGAEARIYAKRLSEKIADFSDFF